MELYEKELALVKKALRENPKGMTVSDISREIRINRNSVAKYLDVLLISGRVEMRSIGPAKVFSLSHRIPLSALLNFSSDYILVLDKELKIVQANDKLVDFIKTERGDLIGHDIKDCKSSPLNAHDMLSKIKGALEGKEFSMEKGFRLNGKVLYLRVKLVPTTFDDGEPGITMIMEDITERKRAENELRIRNRAIETSVNGVAFSDLKGNLTYVNPSFLEMWGYSSGKVVTGRNAVEFWQTRDKVGDIIKSLYEKGGWTGELIAKRKDGSLFNVHLTASMVKDKKGTPICMMGSFIDITESKKAGEALRDSKEKLRRIFESSPDAIIVTDLEGKVTECNRAALDMYGSPSKKDMVGKNAFLIIAERDRERAMENLRKTLAEGSVKNIEYACLKKDGSEFCVELSASVVSDASGNPVSFVSIAKDLTGQKRSEEAKSESEKKFRTIFENVNDMIIYMDKSGKILDINKKVEDVMGYRRDEVIGKSFAKIGVLGAKDAPRILGLFTDMLGGDRTADVMELDIRDRKGNRVPIEANVKVVKREGRKEGLVVIIRKINGNRAKVIS
jgi:PAS domain S-box-containing protein